MGTVRFRKAGEMAAVRRALSTSLLLYALLMGIPQGDAGLRDS